MKVRSGRSILLVLIAAIALVVSGISVSGVSSAGAAEAGAKAAQKKGKRGPRGPRGKTGPRGPAGPAGPGGGGGGTKLRYTANFGTGLGTIFTGPGYILQGECGAVTFTVSARSSADNGLASATQFPNDSANGATDGTIAPQGSQDVDWDINDRVNLNPTNAAGNFVFASSSAAGATSTINGLVEFGTAQGDCVTAGVITVTS